ncbi:hypothetical protein RKE29_02105 [Streptomyces sp. B1866]|uniref:hypothetical protein n=1 Tax=Streptomyces sp. B1866 TaxID=3075431 RepID=UPI002891CAE0|nr:hypothetical protein [Streptomyces sp. B1866]MDT3395454.1 hypothetical protein [Streptomyces sp. B1866]
MPDPRVPPPPPYAPTVGRTTWWTNTPTGTGPEPRAEPRVIVLGTAPVPAPPGRNRLRNLLADHWTWRPTAAACAVPPGIWWGHQVLLDPELSTPGAYVIAAVAITITAALDAARGWWLTATGLYTTLLGAAFLPAEPLITITVYWITGVTS